MCVEHRPLLLRVFKANPSQGRGMKPPTDAEMIAFSAGRSCMRLAGDCIKQGSRLVDHCYACVAMELAKRLEKRNWEHKIHVTAINALDAERDERRERSSCSRSRSRS